MHAPLELRITREGRCSSSSSEGASAWGYHSANCGAVGDAGRRSGSSFTQLLICNDKVNDGAYFGPALELPAGQLGRTTRNPQCSTGNALVLPESRPSPAS